MVSQNNDFSPVGSMTFFKSFYRVIFTNHFCMANFDTYDGLHGMINNIILCNLHLAKDG